MSRHPSTSSITRRTFVRAVASSTMGFASMSLAEAAPSVKIERIDIFPLCYPWSGYFRFIAGSPGHTVMLIKITADNGTVGWGQSLPVPRWSYESPETSLIALRKYFVPSLLGHDPTDIEGANHRMDRALAPSFTTGMPITRAGIDLALHDLAGKLTGQSVAEMWKLPRGGPLLLSWTINARKLVDAEKILETGRQRGYRHFNIKIAPDPKYDAQLVAQVRRQMPEAILWVDANGGYDLASAMEIAPKLAELGVDAFEAPLRPNRISDYQRLKRQGALPITMDEGVISPVEVREFIRLKMVDGMTIKLSRCGGLLTAKRQIEATLDAGLFWLGSGLTDPDISMAASLILYGAYGLKKPAALNAPQFLTQSILAKPLSIKKDVAQVPTGPGLGIEVDEAKVRKLMMKIKTQ